ncbi:restriction endonuclease subunit S [Brevibacterium aurantiacum]|nr:restriction endonuclease subunit S [Brevibacterium aurantiacum]
MSRIDELIQELCPDGVRFLTIGEAATVTAGATPSKSVASYWTNGTIPWLSSGEVNKGTIHEADTLITQEGYDSCSTRMVPAGAVVIALAGQGKTRGMVARTRLECCTNQSLASVVPDSDELDSDFLFYFLRTQYARLRDVSSGDGTRGGLNLSMIRAYRIPVPPLEVQREIVRVLDKFTQLEAELEAELEARRVQYEHYRRELLSGGEGASGRIIPLGEIFEMRAGTHIKAAEISDEPTEEKPYPCYGGNGLRGYVSSYNYDESVIFVGRQGALCGNVHRAEGKIYATEHAVVVTPKVAVDMSWAFHKLTEMDLNQYKTKSAQPGLAVGRVKQVEAQYVPIVDQRRHGEVLDKLDTLVSDISIGLPAELGARREQYEHYRDRLLTFKELTS